MKMCKQFTIKFKARIQYLILILIFYDNKEKKINIVASFAKKLYKSE